MKKEYVKGFNAIVSVPTRKNGEKWIKQEINSCEPIFVNYILNDACKTIYFTDMNKKTYMKKVPKSYYGEIQHNDEYVKHIEKMLSDDWEGDEEIFIPEEECSKPFNTPKILGCVDETASPINEEFHGFLDTKTLKRMNGLKNK